MAEDTLLALKAEEDNAYKSECCKRVIVPEGVTHIGYATFRRCVYLEEVTIPASVLTIGPYAFAECLSLRKLIFPPSVKSIERYAFSRSGLEEISLPEGLEEIADSLFWCCTKLERVTVPHTVTSVGPYAFADCHSLKELSLPQGVTIHENAFQNCDGLRLVDKQSL